MHCSTEDTQILYMKEHEDRDVVLGKNALMALKRLFGEKQA